MSELSCGRMRELAPELALDVLTGHERATAQAHLGMCPQCREYVSSLTQIGDRLLTLVPGAEPPVGFEDRVLAGMGFPGRPAGRERRRWWPLTVAAAAVIAVVFGVGGWVVGTVSNQDTPSAGPEINQQQVVRFAPLRNSDQHQIGQVITSTAAPWWVYMSVTNATAPTVWCELVEQDGRTVPLGSFPLSGGKGSWGQAVDVDTSKVIGARLMSDHGVVLATATFGTAAYPSTQGSK